MQLGCAPKLRSLTGKATHLCRVLIVACYSLFREGATNAAGKELIKVLVNLRRPLGIVFSIKETFEEMFWERLHALDLLIEGSK